MDSIVIIKVIASLLYPVGLAALFAVFAAAAKLLSYRKLSRFLSIACVALLLIASNPQIAKWAMSSLESQYPQRPLSDMTQHDLILVLGGSLKLPIPPARAVQLGSGSDRLWHAAQLFMAGKAHRLMLAGGNVFDHAGLQSEAAYASELLSKWGVAAEAIVTEGKSRNTEQNFTNVLNYLERENIGSVVLVTSAYHMPRALHTFKVLLARKPISVSLANLRITPSTADIYVREDSAPAVLNWIPSANALLINTMVVHEYYGKWFVDLKALIARG